MENEEEYIFYKTSDIYFSAYLSSLDLPLERTEPEDDGGKKKILFIFKVPAKDMARLKASFFGGTGTVRAMKFVQSLRSLKSMCFVMFALTITLGIALQCF
jgi:hypothetical protein